MARKKFGKVPQSRSRLPKGKKRRGKRLKPEAWARRRKTVYERDRGHCQGPLCQHLGDWTIPFHIAHVHHIQAVAAGGNNYLKNLILLCPTCHGLVDDEYHAGLRNKMLSEGKLPSNWFDLLWKPRLPK